MKIINTIMSTMKRRSPLILSSMAVSGVVTTSYLTGKATWEASQEIRGWEEHNGYDGYGRGHGLEEGPGNTTKQRLKERAVMTWKLYIPAAASGVVTIACIVGTARVSNKRAAAAQAAFVLTERAYSEYRNKVIEEYGERKDQTIRDSIAEDRVKNNTPPSAEVLVTGPGNVLCCELHTGRYFASDMETLRKAQNDLNSRLLGQDSSSLDDFYWLIGLNGTSNSSDLGWNSDKLMSLEFTTVLTEDGRPCLAFEYNYIRPIYEGLFK